MELLLNQLVYFAYFQSLFLIAIYLFSPKTRKRINIFLLILVIVLMLGLTGRVLYLGGFFEGSDKVITISEMATLLFGTTVFLFTKSSLSNKRFSQRDLLFYLPAVVYNVFVVRYFILPSNAVIDERINNGSLYFTTMILIGVGLAVNLTFLIKSVGIFLAYRKRLNEELSYVVRYRFFLNFLIAVSICMGVWTGIYLLELSGYHVLTRLIWQIVWFSIAIIILLIAFYSIKDPELFRTQLEEKTKKYSNSKLSATDLEELKERLDRIMIEKKPFLNRKLLKSELADLLDISNPEMSRVLNEKIGMNFFEYVNYFRIKEFVKLAQSEKSERMSFYGLAQEAGFNSKTTFNKSFKEIMGTTPKIYLKEQEGS